MDNQKEITVTHGEQQLKCIYAKANFNVVSKKLTKNAFRQ